ncbi:MAG: acetyl-CoA carboxylase biotin carboxyl carrier protein [Rhodoglobus sp.]|nr:acetyl-CoA carboxylase biotin carboxyl carrier protein [Rhodoglobus sp.]
MSDTNNSPARFDIADITTMIDILRDSGWREARLKWGDFELHLSDGALAASAQQVPAAENRTAAIASPAASAPPSAVAPAAPAANELVVKAASLGVFWRSPQPGAPAFVEVGDEVAADTPLAIIEVMKMMTRVEAGAKGRISAIHVDNAAVVEFDQPLMTITLG